MSYDCKILADSLSPHGVRLTTLEVTFPRFILAEYNTHRLFSRNSASSRAIPPEKLIAKLRKDPFIPETFNKRVKGMGVGAELAQEATEGSRKAWLWAMEQAITAAETLMHFDVDKSRVNRLLEPFGWQTAIISAIEWDNFLALRQPMEGDVPNLSFPAQPEFQISARMIADCLRESVPAEVQHGEWATPLAEPNDYADPTASLADIWDITKKVSTSRCARVSFDTQHDDEPLEKTLERHDSLRAQYHLSPFEHVARPFTDYEWTVIHMAQNEIEGIAGLDPKVARQACDQLEFCGNFRGWRQYRKDIPNEANRHRVMKENAGVQ